MIYDENNVFAKILRGEIPCEKIYEDTYAIAFNDIQPKAPVHALVIPKGSYISFHDFTANASQEEIAGFFIAVQKVAGQLALENNGYRLLTNHGADAGQEVPHFHMHIIGGKALGRLLP